MRRLIVDRSRSTISKREREPCFSLLPFSKELSSQALSATVVNIWDEPLIEGRTNWLTDSPNGCVIPLLSFFGSSRITCMIRGIIFTSAVTLSMPIILFSHFYFSSLRDFFIDGKHLILREIDCLAIFDTFFIGGKHLTFVSQLIWSWAVVLTYFLRNNYVKYTSSTDSIFHNWEIFSSTENVLYHPTLLITCIYNLNSYPN